MKHLSNKTISDGPVSGADRATFNATVEEIAELQQALKVVEKWRHAARVALNKKIGDGDWTMYRFQLLRHDRQVSVDIEQGACG